ncbi:MAG: nucleotidyltransferase domain-containing protein [Defluviitaleaceae bacterium]|nr:nucleotidyltransferase domain-containing protein [Defluviitaleaceae bacterium]MCL2274509.1 nucleotidyltransferase domain-containing protein [Defluviitaleaceae bacterium]
MLKHHEDSIKIMTEHYRENTEIIALFLVGSVATGTAREDSDLDGVAIVPQEYFDRLQAAGGTMVIHHGKCTYEKGYFDIHFKTTTHLQQILENGSEPMRNLFDCATPLFCNDDSLIDLVKQIPILPEGEIAAKQLRYYCTMKQSYRYYWNICKPEGFHRHQIACAMVHCLYRLILLENRILFPSLRKLEDAIKKAPGKPDALLEKCHTFLQNLTDDEANALIQAYEGWTQYAFPTEQRIIANNHREPWEW